MTEYSSPLQFVLDRQGLGGGIVVELEAFIRFNAHIEQSLRLLEELHKPPVLRQSAGERGAGQGALRRTP